MGYTPDEERAHDRWVRVLNRRQGSAGYEARWHGEQCGACRWYVRLISEMGEDWGACINASSAFDRRVMFEHDGCDQFEPADEVKHGP